MFYANISHQESIAMIHPAFSETPKNVPCGSPFCHLGSIVFFYMSYVLNNNVLEFNNKFNYQLFGIVMGTKLAPSLGTFPLLY